MFGAKVMAMEVLMSKEEPGAHRHPVGPLAHVHVHGHGGHGHGDNFYIEILE